jgi:hypothetical protein
VATMSRDATSLGVSIPVMSPDLIRQVPQGVPAKELTYQEAIREALREEMQRDQSVFLMGEDIGKHGGAFGVTSSDQIECAIRRSLRTPSLEQLQARRLLGCAR